MPAPARQNSRGDDEPALAEPSSGGGPAGGGIQDLAIIVNLCRGDGALLFLRRTWCRIHLHPARDEPEGLRGADRAAVFLVNLLAIETQPREAQVHPLIIVGALTRSVQ